MTAPAQPAGQAALDGRRLSLNTPEEVPLVFELAHLGSRAFAFMIDFFIVAASVLLIVAIAIEALQETIRERKATPAEIAEYARVVRVRTVIGPYLMALQ